MKKHTYRAKNVNKLDWSKLSQRLDGQKTVFAVDVAKEKQYAQLSNHEGGVSEIVWWNHPEQPRRSGCALFATRRIAETM